MIKSIGSTEEEQKRKILELQYEKEINEKHPIKKISKTPFFPNKQE